LFREIAFRKMAKACKLPADGIIIELGDAVFAHAQGIREKTLEFSHAKGRYPFVIRALNRGKSRRA